MVFSSFEFIASFFAFLALFSFVKGLTARKIALVAFSLYFYAAWNIWFAPLLVCSVLGNYFAIRIIQTAPWRALYVAIPVVLNLAVLGYFKYAGFFAGALGFNGVGEGLILPLGISFFTFQNITALIYFRSAERQEVSLLDYANYIMFFPQLIAGPIVRYDEIFHQWVKLNETSAANMFAGLKVFTVGMFKKVALADTFAAWSDPMFNNRAAAESITFIEAWAAALSYYFQIYFDFSGYSLMAIGLALCLGIRLPLNFDRPYISRSITEFWRRWHITLSRFLRDYLYIPLGGNRKGAARRYANLLITMLIGGLWHGAGWTFVIWGGLHGLFLSINHAWDRYADPAFNNVSTPVRWVKSTFAWVLTFTAVICAWVLFRAQTFDQAWLVLAAMWAPGEVVLPHDLRALADLGASLGFTARTDNLPHFYGVGQSALFLAAFLLVFFGKADERVGVITPKSKTRTLDFGPIGEPLVYASMFLFCLWLLTSGNSVFIYYQF